MSHAGPTMVEPQEAATPQQDLEPRPNLRPTEIPHGWWTPNEGGIMRPFKNGVSECERHIQMSSSEKHCG